jgi:tetratricopeptide (TPR) repeat protein
VYNNRGTAYLENNQLDLAKRDFEEVLKKDPKNAAAYNNLASLELKQKNYQKTREYCTKAIELDPKLGPAYYNRGLALQMLRDEENCCRDWKKAAELGVEAAKHLKMTFCD